MEYIIGFIVFLFVCWIASWPVPKEEPAKSKQVCQCAQMVLLEESEDGNILHFAILREE